MAAASVVLIGFACIAQTQYTFGGSIWLASEIPWDVHALGKSEIRLPCLDELNFGMAI